jgi:MFS family permease
MKTRLPLVLWLLPAVYFVFVAAEFAAVTEIVLVLTARGASAFEVGLLASALWVGILLSSWRAQPLVQRFGHGRVIAAATALSTLAMASFVPHASAVGWCLGSFVLGLGGGLVWVSGESWLAEAAPPERRGFWVGWFETAVGLGLMAGPALVPLARAFDASVLPGAALLMLLALGATLVLQRSSPAAPVEPAVSAGSAASAASAAHPAAAPAQTLLVPVVAIAAMSGLMESGVSALFPSIAMRSGFSIEAAAWLGTVIGAGSALLQPPVGMVADRFGTYRVVLASWAMVLLATVALLAVAGRPEFILWPVGFVLGGVGGAVYTLLIVEVGHRLRGGALVRMVSTLVIGYSGGTTVGPLVGGAVFDHGGLVGMAWLLAVLAGAGLVTTALTLRPPAAPRAATPAAGPHG